MRSAFDAGEGDATNEVTLQEEEDDDHGYGDEGGGGHHEMVLRAVLGLKLGEADGEGAHLVVGGGDERPEQTIPVIKKNEYGEGGQRAGGEGEDDAEVGSQLTGSVDAGCLEKFIGKGGDELAHEEDAKGAHGTGDDEGGVGIEPLEVAHEGEEGHDDDVEGDHEGGEDEQEEYVFAGKIVFGEGIAGEAAKEEIQQGGGGADEKTVHKIATEGRRVEGIGVVLEAQVVGNPFDGNGEKAVGRFEGTDDHPDEGQADDDCTEDENRVKEQTARETPCAGLAGHGMRGRQFFSIGVGGHGLDFPPSDEIELDESEGDEDGKEYE